MKEVESLKQFRDVTFEDLQTFVKNREKVHWRNWDRYKYVNGAVPTKNLLKNDTKNPLEELESAVDSQKESLGKLNKRLDAVEHDSDGIKMVNLEMLSFVKNQSGGEGWLELFKLSKLRLSQKNQHK